MFRAVEDRQIDPGKVRTEACHHITLATSRRRRSPTTGIPLRTPTMLGTHSIPAACRSLGLERTRGPAQVSMVDRALRPIGVFRDNRWWNTNRMTSATIRCCQTAVSIRTGTWPTDGPAIQVGCLRAASRPISAPELPAPTSSTPPS